jgi:DNA-binding CsgD family transcriptional regulator
MPRGLTPREQARRAELRQLVAAGHSRAAIAAQWGVTSSAVNALWRRMHGQVPRTDLEARRQTMLRLAREGLTRQQIAERLGLASGSTVTTAIKAIVRDRDQHRCRCCGVTAPLEVAHLELNGTGSDHGRRMVPSTLITVCAAHHRGARLSLQTARLRVQPLTAAGADGPVMFLRKLGETWTVLRREHVFNGHRAGPVEVS